MPAPSIDGSAVPYGGNTEFDSTPTFAVTVSSNANRYLKVDVALGYNAASDVTGVTWNGTPLSLVKDSGWSPNSLARVYIFGLVAPESGTYNVVVTLSGRNRGDRVVCAATVYVDVDQSTPTGTAVSAVFDSATPTVNVSSAAGETVVDAISMDGGTSPTIGADQTSRYIQICDASSAYGAGSDEAGAGTVTMSWGGGSGFDSAICAVALKPVSGGGSPALDDSDGFMLTTIQMPLTAVRLY